MNWEKGALVATVEPRRVILSSATSLSLSTQVFPPARQFRAAQGSDAYQYLTNETTASQKDIRSAVLTEAQAREMLTARASGALAPAAPDPQQEAEKDH
eukprot:4907456-Amphidinium_carterae.1